jgi:hypothetical protein
MAIGHDGLLLVCGVGGSSSHYQTACHVHCFFMMVHFELEFTNFMGVPEATLEIKKLDSDYFEGE